MSDQDRKSLEKAINSKRNQFVVGFTKILEEAGQKENAQITRKLEDSSIDYLLHVMVDIIMILSTVSCQSIQNFKDFFRISDLGIYNRLKPSEKTLIDLEKLLNKNKKRKKQYFSGPFEHMQTTITDTFPSIKVNLSLFIYGIAEKMVYHMLEHTVYYEEQSKNTENIIKKTTIELVLKLYEISKNTSTKNSSQSHMPNDYDKCIDHLRLFLQYSYDQCHTIFRLYLDPIRSFLPNSVQTASQYVATFMTIYRTTLESIEDMNDHLSSGGSGRTGEQGLIGYCLEVPTEDYLLNDYSLYANCIGNPNFLTDLQQVLENKDALKCLINCGSNLLKTFTTKYPFNTMLPTNANNTMNFHHSTSSTGTNNTTPLLTPTSSNYPWPSIHHRGCEHCDGLSTSSQINNQNTQHLHDSNMINSTGYECNYLINCFKYVLPRIWFIPIFQFYYLYDIIKHFRAISTDENDQQILTDVMSMYRQESNRIQDQLRGRIDPRFLIRILNRINILHMKEEYRIELNQASNNENINNSTILPLLKLPPIVSQQISTNSLSSIGSTSTANSVGSTKNNNTNTTSTSNNNDNYIIGLSRIRLADLDGLGLPFNNSNCSTTYNLSSSVGNTIGNSIGSNSTINLSSMGGGTNTYQELLKHLDSEFILKSPFFVQSEKKYVQRLVYLFADILLIYKEDNGTSSWRPSVLANHHHHHNQQNNLKLKKFISLQSIHIIDNGCFSHLTPGSILEISNTNNTNTNNIDQLITTSLVSLNNNGSNNLNSNNINNISQIHDDESFLSVDLKPKNCQYHAFSIQYQDFNSKNPSGSSTISTLLFVTDNVDIKQDWMASLTQIQTNKLFEKYIKEIPRQEIPLRLPDPSEYKFAEPDSDDNIRFEKQPSDFCQLSSVIDDDEEENSDTTLDLEDINFREYYDNIRFKTSPERPQIRYATIHKLIERLTFHTYHDTRALHMFLLAYRRFSKPDELLELLIKRFTIPPPKFTEEERKKHPDTGQSAESQMIKRFKNSYQRRVQRRVIWVLHWWISNPSFFRYDFANDTKLRQKLMNFLSSIKSKELQNACRVLRNTCIGYERKTNTPIYNDYNNEDDYDENRHIDEEFDNDDAMSSYDDGPPLFLWKIVQWNELTLHSIHPVELARQITLYEWDLYHRIQYWEVEGKEIQLKLTPNLTRSKQFSNRLRHWFVHSILNEENLEDRVCAILRVTDIFLCCKYWNNFQGSQEAQAALISSAVFRLKKSFNHINQKYRHYKPILSALRTIAEGGKPKKGSIYNEKYEESIRRIEESNPPVPCVPFIALGVNTKLIHAEIATPNTIVTENGHTLINYRKHLLLSQIIDRYLSFQRLPYNFRKHEETWRFLESIDPLKHCGVKNDDEFEQMMFERSEKFEPRDSDNVDNFVEKERRLSRLEQKLADILNTSTRKDKLDFQKFQSQLSIISQYQPSSLSTIHRHIPISQIYTSDQSIHHQQQIHLPTSPTIASPTTSTPSTIISSSPQSINITSHSYISNDNTHFNSSASSPTNIPPLPPKASRLIRNHAHCTTGTSSANAFSSNTQHFFSNSESFHAAPVNSTPPSPPPMLPPRPHRISMSSTSRSVPPPPPPLPPSPSSSSPPPIPARHNRQH